MKTYTGIIEDMGDLVGPNGNRSGKIEFLIIGKETLRRINCYRAVFNFMKIGMTATIYVVSIPILGKAIIGVKDMSNSRKFMASNSEITASCIMVWFILSLIFILPAYLIGVWILGIIIPLIIAAITYFDYTKAKSLP